MSRAFKNQMRWYEIVDDYIYIYYIWFLHINYINYNQLYFNCLLYRRVQLSFVKRCNQVIQHKHLHNDGCPTDTSLILMYNDAYTVCKFAMYIHFTYVCFHESVGSFDIRTVPVLTAADFASTCDWSYQCGYLGGSVMARDVYLASSALGNDWSHCGCCVLRSSSEQLRYF